MFQEWAKSKNPEDWTTGHTGRILGGPDEDWEIVLGTPVMRYSINNSIYISGVGKY